MAQYRILPFWLVSALVSATAICVASRGFAQDDVERGSSAHFHADVEIDPFAYALGGYSVHAGVGHRGFRLSLGAFALDLPSFLEPDEAFETAFNGFGIKIQYFPFSDQAGPFVGLDTNVAYQLIQSEASDAAARRRGVASGAALGWRFLIEEFYFTPWLGVGYDFLAEDVELDGGTYEAQPVTPFATVHLGYRFR